jgi:uncharacterized integral membrane protein
MWIVKMVLWVVLMLFLVFFASENAQQEVQIQFWKWESDLLPLWLVMFFSFAAGVLMWLVISIFKIIQLNSEVRKLKKENKKISGELDNLRSVSIEEETRFPDEKFSKDDDASNQTLLLP